MTSPSGVIVGQHFSHTINISPDKGAFDPKDEQKVSTPVMMDLTADSPQRLALFPGQLP